MRGTRGKRARDPETWTTHTGNGYGTVPKQRDERIARRTSRAQLDLVQVVMCSARARLLSAGHWPRAPGVITVGDS
jgi:hypothetical protein